MKRLLIAGLLAVGIHGLLLEMGFGWLKKSALEKPVQRPISITLTVRQPQIPVKKVADEPSVVPEKRFLRKPAPLKKKTTPRAAKPEQQKRTKPSVQPVEKKRPTPAPKTASESVQELTPNKLRYMPQTSATEEMVVPADQTVIEARPLYRTNPPPKYPAIARRRGFSGQVVLDVLVGESGRVVDLRLATSSGYDMLDDAAVAAVKTWIFEPGLRGNQKVEMWVRVPIRFKLK